MNYIPNTPNDIKIILEKIGIKSTDELFSHIPKEVLSKKKIGLPEGATEIDIVRELHEIGIKNRDILSVSSFLGAGAYFHFVPPVVDFLSSRGEFATAYTPYQPEVSQGTLTAIFEYQSMVSYIFGVEVVNASMYDGASSLSEAVLMAANITGKKRFLVSSLIHPEYLQVINTYVKNRDIEIIEVPSTKEGRTNISFLGENIEDVAAVLIGYPNFFGIIENLKEIKNIIGDTLLITSTPEPISLGVIVPPGMVGADIVTGEGMSFGNPLAFGGPYLGIFGTSKKYVRRMPGRLVGQTKDQDGNRGYVLTLSTREQHIRRAKATSNICSNEGLCALRAAIYLALLGKEGFYELSEYNLALAHRVKDIILSYEGFSLKFKAPFFNEFVIETRHDPEKLYNYLLDRDIIFGLPLGRYIKDMENCFLINVTEMVESEDLEKLQRALEEYSGK